MKTPSASAKKRGTVAKTSQEAAPGSTTNNGARAATAEGKVSRRRTPRTSANVRAPQGVAALTSAAMLAAMQPAARKTARTSSPAARAEFGLHKSISPERFSPGSLLGRAMQWARRCISHLGAHLPGKPMGGRTLQLVEMQSLGEKRFVAVLRVGGQRFLIGGAAGSVQMLGEVGETAVTVIPPRPLQREKA